MAALNLNRIHCNLLKHLLDNESFKVNKQLDNSILLDRNGQTVDLHQLYAAIISTRGQ